MMTTYHVVVPFTKDNDGTPMPLEAVQAPSLGAARGWARRAAQTHAGAVAFSRTGDPDTGEYLEAEVIAVYGTVDVERLVK